MALSLSSLNVGSYAGISPPLTAKYYCFIVTLTRLTRGAETRGVWGIYPPQ